MVDYPMAINPMAIRGSSVWTWSTDFFYAKGIFYFSLISLLARYSAGDSSLVPTDAVEPAATGKDSQKCLCNDSVSH